MVLIYQGKIRNLTIMLLCKPIKLIILIISIIGWEVNIKCVDINHLMRKLTLNYNGNFPSFLFSPIGGNIKNCPRIKM